MSGETGRHQWKKEPRLEIGATSGKQESTQQDLQEDCRAEDRKANSEDFHYTAENKRLDIVERLATSETKKEMAHRVGAINVAALTTLGTFGCTNQRKMMVTGTL
jgi:hypothetical protein